MAKNRLEIEEYDDYFSLEFSWYSSMSFFILLFTIIWNAFLFFWYSMAFTIGAPWIMVIFPLIHVAIGLWLIYKTLSGFLNKTNMVIDSELLTVRHGPIPVWKKNIDISVKNLEQLYVKQNIHNNNDSTTFTYDLMAKMKSGIIRPVLNVGVLESEEVQAIENRIEHYLGIIDRPVKGEFGTTMNASISTNSKNVKPQAISNEAVPRKMQMDQIAWLKTKLGGGLFYDGKLSKVLHKVQYDWKNGESDLQLQLVDEEQTDVLLFVKQDKAIYKTFVERKMGIVNGSQIKFDQSGQSETVEFNNQVYQLIDYKEGESFINGRIGDIKTKQWIYQTTDQKHQIRIIDQNDLMSFYRGEKVNSSAFDNPHENEYLDINEPRKDYQIDYDEEDLV